MRLPVLLALALACSSSTVLAGATDWQELAPNTRLRLIASESRSADGKTLVALELEMPQSTKTYWRVPGESGIPTEISLKGSDGVTGYRFIWPFPIVEQQDGLIDFVYRGPTVIPIELEVGTGTAVVEASVIMGVCSDICIPATADFALPLDFSKPDPGQDLRITQALALAPIPWEGADQPVGQVALNAASGVLEVPIDETEVDPNSVIADASESGHLLGAPQKSPEGGLVALPLIGGDDAARLEGQSVRLIFMTRDGPYEVLRRVEASTSGGQ